MRKGECEGKREERSLEKSLEIGFETGKSKKRWTSQGKKRARFLEKSPGIGFETGKSAKNGDFGAKKVGGGAAKKWALLPILQCYEVAKWVQMNFSRIFFSAISCREWENALPLHSQSGSNALAREGYALKAPRQRKRCCDL